jgi:arabinofuranan 3-O-arabinosyltransferase
VINAPARPRGDTLPTPDGPGPDERIRGRIRLIAFCLLLEVLPFVTAPGNVIADTKLDLAIDPVRFLSRALTLWDPQQFGQLQDQAVGYLFPMGPFFALGRSVALEPWVVQRLWIGAVCVAAFLGTVRLAGRLGIGTPWTRVAAGLAYAMSPAGLTLLGQLSSEFLPAAMLPWILIPLVDAARGGRRGRAAAQSAAAVALCGGVNAAATLAVLVPAISYVLTLAAPAPRWRILAWWGPAVALATVWWAVPLLLLSRYGVSIVSYTESAAVTTSVTSLSNILRGTENWVGYLVVNGQPWWQLGYRLATGALPALATGLIAGLGLAGLVRRGLPERRFLLLILLAGVIIISAGYVSSLGNPLAGSVDHLINGPASAFRNVRKFDPMIRLPVAAGLAHLLASERVLRRRTVVSTATALAIGSLVLPAYLSGLAGSGSFPQIPSYWVSAGNWLNRHAGHQAVLVAPGSAFGEYLWGSPLDDVLQPLTTVDWAEQDLSTIGSPGNERLLDAIDRQLAAGDGSAGLTQLLARMGVKYVLVSNDLIRSGLNGAWPARVHQALAASPGIRKVAQFGLPVGSVTPDDAVTNFDTPYPPVEIYRVQGAMPVATVQPAAGTLRVYGGPEALLTLADEGLLGSRPVLLNSDSPRLAAAATVATDSLRRRVRDFGELRASYSPTLTATQPAQTFEATGDYTEPGWSRYLAVARYRGIANVTASSSASDIGAIPAQWASGLQPYSAVDGDPRTRWESGSWTGPTGQWIRIDFDSPVDPLVIQVAFADRAALGPAVTQVAVRTSAGQRIDPVRITGRPQALRVPPGASGWLRITVTGLASQPDPAIGAQASISEISVPGVRASRTIAAPAVPAQGGGDPAAVLLAKAEPPTSGCMSTSLRWVCSPLLATPTEEQYGFDEAFTEPVAGQAQLRGSAVLTAPSLIQKYARFGRRQARVTASSTYTADPEDQPRSAFDGDPATTWVASPGDAHPRLTIRWGQRRTVSQVAIQRPAGAAGLLQVLVVGSAGQVRGGMVGPAGILAFAPMRATGLTLRFTPLQAPLQISGVAIPGVQQLGTQSVPFRLKCGLGPLIELNGRVVKTRVSGTFAELLTGRPLRFTACSLVTLARGANRVVEPDGDAFDVQDVAAVRPGDPALSPAAPAAVARVESWTSRRRVLRVTAATRSYLVVNENFNAGWQARTDGRRLRAVRLDGWKQAWLLPAGTAGVVTLTYPPGALYRVAIAGGLGALALVLLVALWPAVPGAGRGRAPVTAAAPGRSRRSRRSRRERRIRVGPGSAGALTAAAIVCGLLLAGFWLGGYPGAVILVAATGLFLAAASYRHSRRSWLELSRPRVLAGLLLAAAACGAAGEHLLLAGGSSLVVTGLWNVVPQIICLVVLGRLAAALILPDGDGHRPGLRPGGPPYGSGQAEAPRRALDQVVARDRDEGGARSDRQDDARHLRSGVGPPVEGSLQVQDSEEGVSDEELPEEDAVGDLASEAGGPAAQ